jgi:hypothetical protein
MFVLGFLGGLVLASASPTVIAVPVAALLFVGYVVLTLRSRHEHAGRAPRAPRHGWGVFLGTAAFTAYFFLFSDWLLTAMASRWPIIPLRPQ